MLTKNDWYVSNLKDRLQDKSINFSADINPFTFHKMGFDEAVKLTVMEINNNFQNLYLALSGGLDSEFILRAFHKNSVHIKPVIVCCGNETENVYAYKVCEELNIEPTILNIDEKEFLKIFENDIVGKLNGLGYNTTQVLFAADYVQKQNGTLITGNHIIGDDDTPVDESVFAYFNEWDFYVGVLFPNLIDIDFFNYTPEICYSLISNWTPGLSWQKFKSQLYDIEYRNKMRANYSKDTRIQIIKLLKNRHFRPEYKMTLSRNEIMDLFNRKLIQ
jgi:hypothetical protein